MRDSRSVYPERGPAGPSSQPPTLLGECCSSRSLLRARATEFGEGGGPANERVLHDPPQKPNGGFDDHLERIRRNLPIRAPRKFAEIFYPLKNEKLQTKRFHTCYTVIYIIYYYYISHSLWMNLWWYVFVEYFRRRNLETKFLTAVRFCEKFNGAVLAFSCRLGNKSTVWDK